MGDDASKRITQEEYRRRLRALYKVLGAREDTCKCGATIWFVRTKNGRSCPYTVDGVAHFADCPHASEFRR